MSENTDTDSRISNNDKQTMQSDATTAVPIVVQTKPDPPMPDVDTIMITAKQSTDEPITKPADSDHHVHDDDHDAAYKKFTPHEVGIVFAALSLTMFVAALDQTVVNVSLPTIVEDFGQENLLSWIISSYMLTESAVIPLVGRLSDMFGRNLIFQLGLDIFLLGSLLCGLSNSMMMLIFCRGIQGIGGGTLQAMTAVLMGDVASPRERSKYQGILAGFYALASVIGPLIGGFFTDGPGWRWIFFINLPVGGCTQIVSWYILRKLQTKLVPGKVDVLGSLLIMGCAAGIMLTVTFGGETYAWDSSIIIGLIVASIVLMILFVVNELYVSVPILMIPLFKNRTFAICCTGAFAAGFPMFCLFTYYPVLLQNGSGYSATSTGLRMIPLTFGLVFAGALSGAYTAKTGKFRAWPVIGFSVLTLGVGLMSLVYDVREYGYHVIFLLICGMGIGFAFPVMTFAVQNAVPPREMASATSAVSFIRDLGAAVGLAIYGAVLTSDTAKYYNEGYSPTEAVFYAMKYIFLYCIPPCIFSIVIFVFLPNQQLAEEKKEPVPLETIAVDHKATMDGNVLPVAATEVIHSSQAETEQPSPQSDEVIPGQLSPVHQQEAEKCTDSEIQNSADSI